MEEDLISYRVGVEGLTAHWTTLAVMTTGPRTKRLSGHLRPREAVWLKQFS